MRGSRTTAISIAAGSGPEPTLAVGSGQGWGERVGRQRGRVFFGQVQVRQVRHHAQHRHTATLFKYPHPIGKERRVAAELVDDQPAHQPPLFGWQQCQRAEQLREHPATVDVAHQQHRRVGVASDCHVDDVVGLEV
jgi:hypothetical protein